MKHRISVCDQENCGVSLSPVYFTFHKKIGIKVVSWEELAGRVKSWKRMGRGRTPHKP